jgi:hypothetical protein
VVRRNPAAEEWIHQPLIACSGGALNGQWFTLTAWDERRRAEAHLIAHGQRPSGVAAYAPTGDRIANPGRPGLTGSVWSPTYRPATTKERLVPTYVITQDPKKGTPYRVLLTGSRTWDDTEAITSRLDAILAEHPGMILIHGACVEGADAIASGWAARRKVWTEAYPADWSTGKGAGPARNRVMVAAGADECLAFVRDASTGATGCADMAEAAGITTHREIRTSAPSALPAPPITPARGASGTVRRDALVTAALAYAERGWHVFPLRTDDKRPAFPDHAADRCRPETTRDPRCRRAGRHVSWEERATTDPARIRAAWTSAPYGIGIATGPSGLLVIDLDQPKPDRTGALPPTPPEWAEPGIATGDDVFALLCQRAGHPAPWDTYTVHTGSGGTHLYFTAPTGPDAPQLRCTAGTLGWLIDTRAHGGYVVAPPSTVAGRPYAAIDDDTAPLPGWLAEALTPAPLPTQEPTPIRLRAGGDDRARAYLVAAIKGAVDAVSASQAGQHNRALYLAEEVAYAVLLPPAIEVGQGVAEAQRTIASGMRNGAGRPRYLPGTVEGRAA